MDRGTVIDALIAFSIPEPPSHESEFRGCGTECTLPRDGLLPSEEVTLRVARDIFNRLKNPQGTAAVNSLLQK